MDWIQQWQSKLNKQNGVAPLVRTGGSRHTGLAALPHRNIHSIKAYAKGQRHSHNNSGIKQHVQKIFGKQCQSVFHWFLRPAAYLCGFQNSSLLL